MTQEAVGRRERGKDLKPGLKLESSELHFFYNNVFFSRTGLARCFTMQLI